MSRDGFVTMIWILLLLTAWRGESVDAARAAESSSSSSSSPPPPTSGPSSFVDVIVIGAGTAGSYVLKELVPKFPNLSFVVVDAGTFVSSFFGATAPISNAFAQAQSNTTRRPLTMVDIPGEYNNLAFTSQIDPLYQLTRSTWAFQGRAIGGNANFNGQLIQIPEEAYFATWPPSWQATDMQAYFTKVLSECNVTSTPSSDRRHYANQSVGLLSQVAAKLGAVPATSPHLPASGSSIFGPPNVATSGESLRCYPTTQLQELFDENGNSRYSNLRLIDNAQVLNILLNDSNSDPESAAIGIEYTVDLNNKQSGAKQQLFLSPSQSGGDGRVILAAGAVYTPWILYQSGIGPQRLHHFVYPFGSNFTVDNGGVGVRMADHVGSAVVVQCKNYSAFESYTYTPSLVKEFVEQRTGPYAQYAPVFVYYNASTKVEIFANPWGLGTAAQGSPTDTWNDATTFSLMAVSFNVRPRTYVMLEENNDITYPMIYNNAGDMQVMAETLTEFVGTLLNVSKGECQMAFGPGVEPFTNLSPYNVVDMFNYVNAWGPVDGVVWWSHLGMNHYVGSAPLTYGGGTAKFGVDSDTLLVGGTSNIHAVDASIIPSPVWAHPLATILAVAAKAADILSAAMQKAAN